MHDPSMDRLSEYLDETLDRSEREPLEAHLARCADCVSVLADLKAVRARARKLRDAPVPAGVWARIEAGIAERSSLSFPSERTRAKRTAESGGDRGARFSFSLPEMIAACLGIAILSGGSVFALLKHQEPPLPASAPQTSVVRAPDSPDARARTAGPAEGDPREGGPPRTPEARAARAGVEAVTAQRTPESPHEEAITELRKALAKERDRLDPATIRTLESNLAIIDLAIDQAKRALLADPANTYVKEHLAETMRRKVELLQRATLLASASGPEGSR